MEATGSSASVQPYDKYPWDWTPTDVVLYLSTHPASRYHFDVEIRTIFIERKINGYILLSPEFTQTTLIKLGVDDEIVHIALFNVINALRRRYPLPEQLEDHHLPLPPTPRTSDTETTVLRYDLVNETYSCITPVCHSTPSRPLSIAWPSNQRKRVSPNDRHDEDNVSDAGTVAGFPTPQSQSSPPPTFQTDDYEADGDSNAEKQLGPKRPKIIYNANLPDEDIDRDIEEVDEVAQEAGFLPASESDIYEDDDTPIRSIIPVREVSGLGTSGINEESGRTLESTSESMPPQTGQSNFTENTARTVIRTPRRKQLPVRRVFYLGNSSLTAMDVTLGVKDQHSTDDWTVPRKESPPGNMIARNKLLKGFLAKKASQWSEVNGKTVLGYRPFTPRHIRPHQRLPVTIISANNVALNQDLKAHIYDFPDLHTPRLNHRRQPDRVHLMDDQNELHQRYLNPHWSSYEQELFASLEARERDPGENEFVPVYYDRDESPGIDEDTLREMEAEKLWRQGNQRKRNKEPLSMEEIRQFFSEVRESIVAKWKETTLPKLEKRKFSIWVKGRKDLRVNLGINRKELQELDQRIDKHVDEYCSSTWYHQKDLKKLIVGNSKLTITNKEELAWKDGVIRGAKPERPARRARKVRSSVIQDPEEEEDILTEDSEISLDDDDELRDFIVEDDVYDEGGDDIRQENEAVIATLGNRWESSDIDNIEIHEMNEDLLDVVPADLTENASAGATDQDISSEKKKGKKNSKGKARAGSVTREEENEPRRGSSQYTWFDVDNSSPVPRNSLEVASPKLANESKSQSKAATKATPKIKREPGLTPIITNFNSTLIDLTMDEEAAEKEGTKVQNSEKTSRPFNLNSEANPFTFSDDDFRNDSDDDVMYQIALEESRLEAEERDVQEVIAKSRNESRDPRNDEIQSRGGPSSRQKPVLTPTKPSFLDITAKTGEPWRKFLKESMDKSPEQMPLLRQIIDQSSAKLKDRILGVFDGLKDGLKDNEYMQKLGVRRDEFQAHKILTEIYLKYKFPDGNPVREHLASPFAVGLFAKTLEPLLDQGCNIIASRNQNAGRETLSHLSPLEPSGTSKNPRSLPWNSQGSTSGSYKSSQAKQAKKGKDKHRSDIEDSDSNSERELDQRRSSVDASLSQNQKGKSSASRPKKRRQIQEDQQVLDRRLQQKKDEDSIRKRKVQQKSQKEEIVNLGHLAKFGPIYFPDDMGVELYPFQKEAIQFMFQNVVSGKQRSGVLLAHTMGMGKTRQVITLLGTIAEAALSDEANIRDQIPEDLKRMRALVIAPPGLLENWKEEIIKWGFEDILKAHLVTVGDLEDKVATIENWVNDGTVLLIGYETFRELALMYQKSRKSLDDLERKMKSDGYIERPKDMKDLEKWTKRMSATENVESWLLKTPTIVVADEAHKLKNSRTQTSEIFQRFVTRSHIAMTGSPLANNLFEYFNIMKWVDETIMGNESEFSSNYVYPIEDGLYADSKPDEILTSKKKLNALQKILKLKMHRCNITDISNKLPRKTEFLIALPPTDLQSKIYHVYAKEVRIEAQKDEIRGFFDFIRQLGVLLNHPAIFWKTLKERIDKTGEKADGSDENSDVSSDDIDLADDAVGQLNASIFRAARKIIEKYKASLEEIEHSNRIIALMKIIESCIAIQDKILIFSHSLATLDFIGNLLSEKYIHFARIDGKVSTTKRQDLAKGFEKDDTLIFLISTKAGGLGLNIQSANRIVIFDCNFSPQEEEQAVGRSYRLGQTKPVFVYRFRICGTYEDVLHNKSIFKLSLANRVVDKKNPGRFAKKNTQEEWFKPLQKVEKTSIAEFRGKDPKVLDKLLDEGLINGITLQETYEMHVEEPDVEELDEINPEQMAETENSMPPSTPSRPRPVDVSSQTNNRTQSAVTTPRTLKKTKDPKTPRSKAADPQIGSSTKLTPKRPIQK